MNKELKSKSLKLASQGKYSEALENLEQAGLSTLVGVLFSKTKENNWHEYSKSRKVFWEEYSHQSIFFTELFSGDYKLKLLHSFFRQWDFINPKFLTRLSDELPDVFIEGVRLSQVFFNPKAEWLITFMLRHKNERIKKHGAFIRLMVWDEERIWKQTEDCLKKLENKVDSSLFLEISFWLEKRLSETNTKKGISKLMDGRFEICKETVSQLISYLYSQKASFNIDSEEMEAMSDNFKKRLTEHAKISNRDQNLYFEALDALEKHTSYIKGVVDLYSFDFSFEASISDGKILIKSNDSNAFKQTMKNSLKNRVWHRFIYEAADITVENYLKSDTEILKKYADPEKQEFKNNFRDNLALKIMAREIFIEDIKSKKYSTDDIILMLATKFRILRDRYIEPSIKYFDEKPGKWQAFLVNNLRVGNVFSLVLFTKDEMAQNIEKAVQCKLSEPELNELFSILSHPVKQPAFNRFHGSLDINSPIYLRTPKYFIGFSSIQGRTDPIIGFLTNQLGRLSQLNIERGKKETEKMERRLAARFRRIGFSNIMFSRKYGKDENETISDFDIVVHHKGVLLLIEMKRTKLRFDRHEVWDEYRNSTINAKIQLQKAKKYIQEHFDDFKSKHNHFLKITASKAEELKIYSYVVSNSFNNDHEVISEGIRKVSYFEISALLFVWWRENNKGNFELQDLIDKIERNAMWNYLNEFDDQIGELPEIAYPIK